METVEEKIYTWTTNNEPVLENEIENPFSMTVMLQPLDTVCNSPIGWEMDKEFWKIIRSDEVGIALPTGALLPLRD